MQDVTVLKKSFSRLFLGLLFFANPLFSFVDVLPDFFGCFFLFSALRPLLFLDARVQAARRQVRLLALVSLGRLLLTPVYFFSTTYDGGNTAMLVSFSLAVVSILLEYSFVKNLFESYNYLSVRCDSQTALAYLDPAASLLCMFVFVKNVCSALPDMLTLFSPESTLEYNPGSERVAASFVFAKSVSLAVLFVAVFIFGIVVCVRLSRYVKAVRAEEGYLARVCEAAHVAEEGDTRLKARFDISGSLAMLTALALFSFDYYLDYVSVLPSPVSPVLCILILRRVRAWYQASSALYILPATGFLATLGAYLYRAFYSQDTLVGVTFHTRPFTVLFGVLQSVFCLLCFVVAAFAVTRAAKTALEIDLSCARNATLPFSVVSAALCAYNYVLPKGAGVTDFSEAIAFFAIAAGVVFVVFSWRIDSAFKKESEWKFY